MSNEKNNKTYYKYKSLQNLECVLDIIVNKRLYAGKFEELNDPMEGVYYYTKSREKESFVKLLSDRKNKYGICSLGRKADNDVLWAHYADNRKGIVIAVKIKNNKDYEIVNMVYKAKRPFLEKGLEELADKTAKDLLSVKLYCWRPENETRVLVKDKSYIDVEIHKIIFGNKVDDEKEKLIKQVAKKYDEKIKFSYKDW